MELRFRLNRERLLPFGPFRSVGQIAFWVATWVGATLCLSLFVHDRQLLLVQTIGMAVGALWGGWFGLLPYELTIKPLELRECLIRVDTYLARSKMIPSDPGDMSCPGVGEWVPNRRFVWEGMQVTVTIEAGAVIVRGPRSMIRPLWRNFKGVWRPLIAFT
jgi:hypothetical protein